MTDQPTKRLSPCCDAETWSIPVEGRERMCSECRQTLKVSRRIDDLERTIARMRKAAQRATVALNFGQVETVAQALAEIRREGE